MNSCIITPFFGTERPASPAPKANNDLVRATFYIDYAKVKGGLALGVRVHAIVIRNLYISVHKVQENDLH